MCGLRRGGVDWYGVSSILERVVEKDKMFGVDRVRFKWGWGGESLELGKILMGELFEFG